MNDRTIKYLFNRTYSNQVFSISDIEEIFKKHLLLIGCGGVGTVVLNNLVQAGFKNFTLIDGDDVETSNLNRQLFFNTNDIGRSKVDVLQEKLLLINKDIAINTKKIYIQSKDDLIKCIDEDNYSLIINCADQPMDIYNIVGTVSSTTDIPLVCGFVGLETGTVGPVFDINNTFKKTEFEFKSLIGSISSTNMAVSSLLSHLIIDYMFRNYILKDYQFYKAYVINFRSMKIESYD